MEIDPRTMHLAPGTRRVIVGIHAQRSAHLADSVAHRYLDGRQVAQMTRREYRALLSMLRAMGTPAGDVGADALLKLRARSRARRVGAATGA